MYGTFKKAFPEAGTSPGYFPKWQLTNYQNSKATTSQVYPSQGLFIFIEPNS